MSKIFSKGWYLSNVSDIEFPIERNKTDSYLTESHFPIKNLSLLSWYLLKKYPLKIDWASLDKIVLTTNKEWQNGFLAGIF